MKAVFFDPSLTGGKRLVSLSFRHGAVCLKDDGIEKAFPLASLKLEQGGSNNKLLFFYPEGHNKETFFYLSLDAEIIKTLKETHPIFSKYVRRWERERVLIIASVGVILSFVFAACYLAFGSKQSLAQRVASSIPLEQERKLGHEISSVIVPSRMRIVEESVNSDLSQLLAPLIAVFPPEMEKTQIIISKNAEINAFALPGGTLVFNLGLLKKASTPEEILGVAAHELVHVYKRHVLSSMVQNLSLFVIISAAIGDASGIIAVMVENGGGLLGRSFSRDWERQADRIGHDFLVKARISPMGMVRFFEILLEEEEKSKALVPGGLERAMSFLSTHPDTKERIKVLTERFSAVDSRVKSEIVPVQFDLKAFQKRLKAF